MGSSTSFIVPIEAMLFASTRLMAMFIVFPLLQQKAVGNMVRAGLAVSLGCLVVPVTFAQMPQVMDASQIIFIVAKEAMIGVMLGYCAGLLFWAVEGMGSFVDQQTGASSSAVVEPMSGHPQGPTGGFLLQIFGTLLMTSGGFLTLLRAVYDSFVVWPVFATAPILARGFDQFLTLQWDSLTDLLLKLSAPIVLLLVLIELALGLVARYLHSLDVHFQSMAIKQIVSIVMLATLLTMFFSTAMAMFSPDSQVRLFIHRVSPDYRPNH